MKNNLTKLNIAQLVKVIGFLFFFLIITAVVVKAQPPDPGTDPNAPIDGGLSLLIAAGVGYGAKKIREKKKQQEEEANK